MTVIRLTDHHVYLACGSGGPGAIAPGLWGRLELPMVPSSCIQEDDREGVKTREGVLFL